MSKNNNVPQHIQRLRAMEERLIRESKEGEMRLQNDLDYAKSNAVKLIGTQAASKVSEQNAFVGGLIAKAFTPKRPKKQYATDQTDRFITDDQRLRPTLRRGNFKFGFKSLLEGFILPVVYGLVRGKMLVAGIKVSGKLMRTFIKRVRKAI